MNTAITKPDDSCRGAGKADVHIRWMIRRDMPEVLNIEQLNFEFPWAEDDFLRCLRQLNVIGMVAECRSTGTIRGYMIYELLRDRIHVLNFAVLPSWQRFGIGTAMIRKLQAKLTSGSRTHLTLEVRETNLPAQLFFKSQGFRAVSLLKDFYRDSDEDAYQMQYRVESANQP